MQVMFENVDELLLCRPYVSIWALVVGRIYSKLPKLNKNIFMTAYDIS